MAVSVCLRALFDASPNAYMVVDRGLRFVDANATYLAATRTRLEDLIGKPVFEVFPNKPDDMAARMLRLSFEKVLETRERDALAMFPYPVRRISGGEMETRYWSSTQVPIFGRDGEVELILQHVVDVTDLRALRTEHASAAHVIEAGILDRAAHVQQSNVALDLQLRDLRTMLEQAPGFTCFFRGPDHVFEMTNPAFDSLLGCRDVIGKPVRDSVPDVLEPSYYELLDEVYRSGKPFLGRGMPMRVMRDFVEPEDVFVDFVCQPIFGDDGETLGIFVQGHEVTVQKRGEIRQRFLTLATQHLSSGGDDVDETLRQVAAAAVVELADWCSIDLFEVGAGKRIAVTCADPADHDRAQALMGYPATLESPGPDGLLGGIGTEPRIIREVDDHVLEHSARSAEHLALLRELGLHSGLALPLWHRGRPFGLIQFGMAQTRRRFNEGDRAAAAELGRVTSTMLDNVRLSAEREQLLALEQAARSRAEAANEAKDEFLAMLGHELRNPLAPILTAVQLMALRDPNAPRELAVVERQVGHLARLVDDLLDVSRISRGKIQLRQEVVEIATTVTKAMEIAMPLIEQKQHRLTTDVGPSLRVFGDEARLTQVIANLLSNAARYTNPGGHVHVRATRAGDTIELGVRDNGIGIEREMLPRIFDLFVQAPRSAARSEGGLGLGLTLVRRLVEMHNGTVTATSSGLGEGSEILVRLPAHREADLPGASRAAAPAERSHSGVRVLVVDDNVDAAIMLGELLERGGHEVMVVHDGESALAQATEHVPDVAVIDLGLPGMDGVELAHKLRDALDGRTPRMLALTGYGAEQDRARTREAGFAAHLTKPVDAKTLLQLITSTPSSAPSHPAAG